MVVTLTLIVQDPEAAIDPPERLKDPEPATAVTEPPQVLERALGVEIVNPLNPTGSVSLKPTPVSAVDELLLVMVKERLLVPPGTIVDGVNASAIDGGASAVNVADAADPVPTFVEVTVLVVLL